jgi:hypothetical protein
VIDRPMQPWNDYPCYSDFRTFAMVWLDNFGNVVDHPQDYTAPKALISCYGVEWGYWLNKNHTDNH